MARSAEALEKRARKRNRTLEEQQAADSAANNKPKKLRPSEKRKQQKVAEAVTEPGAWICPSCANVNFASRLICNSNTCQEPKPAESAIQAPSLLDATRINNYDNNKRDVMTSPQKASSPDDITRKKHKDTSKYAPKNPDKKKKKKRHDPEKTNSQKTVEWDQPQATPTQIYTNRELRERYIAKDPTLSEHEMERAKLLIARDERKQQKKMAKKNKAVIEKEEDNNKPKTSEEQRKDNLKLMKKYEQTKGEGMKETDVKRAKILILRRERKAQRDEKERIAAKKAKKLAKAAKKRAKEEAKEQRRQQKREIQ